MKITIFPFGSRGDIQPFLALAVGLQGAGHRVTLVAPHTTIDWIQSYGVAVQPTRFDLDKFFQRPEGQALIKSGNGVLTRMRLLRRLSAGLREALDDFWQAAQGADFVVQTLIGLGGVEAATQRGLPLALAFLQPLAPTRTFPSYFMPFRSSLGGGLNRLTHQLVLDYAFGGAYGAPLNQWRRARFGLRPWRSYSAMLNARRSFGTPWLFGFSPSVLPAPADWEDYQHVTGYWFLDAPSAWQPPVGLTHFLASGPPPVYIGFGTMGDRNVEQRTRMILRALELSEQRAVLAPGWGGLTRGHAPANVFYLENVPHAWLFPRMAAVVHHGGAGTTAAALRAGVPSVITPFVIDQYAWADLVVKLGVSPRTTDIHKLTAEKLAAAICVAVSDSALRARAAALGERIRAEDGVARAVEIIERHAAQFKS